MAEGAANLKIGINGQGAKVGAGQVNAALGSIQNRAKAAINDLRKMMKGLSQELFSLRGLLVGLGVGAFLKQIYEVNVEFQRFNASLKTITGSQEGATAALAALQAMAASTPFSLRTLTDAFIQLRSSGLAATEESLTAFGNIASSFGRDITDMSAAMASASVGMYRSLASFGIKIVHDGDKLRAVFQGQTTMLENSSAAVEKYVTTLGNTALAGQMANQMDTMAGRASNLGDNIDRLIVSIGEGGFNSAMEDLLDLFLEATSGGDDFAEAIGEVLGGAISFATDALRFFIENWEIIEALLVGAAVGAIIILTPLILTQTAAILSSAAALMIWAAAWLLTPFGLITAAIVGITALLWYFSDSMITLGDTTATVGDFVGGAWDWLSEKVGDLVIFLAESFNWLAEKIGESWDWIVNSGASSFLSGLWDGLIGGLKSIINYAIGLFMGLVDVIGLVVEALEDPFGGGFDNFFARAEGVIGAALERDYTSEIGGAAEAALGGAFDTIGDYAEQREQRRIEAEAAKKEREAEKDKLKKKGLGSFTSMLGQDKGGDGEDAEKKAEKLREAFLELMLAADGAEERLGITFIDPNNIEAIEVANELIEFKNKLLKEGIELDDRQLLAAEKHIKRRREAEREEKQLLAIAQKQRDLSMELDTATREFQIDQNMAGPLAEVEKKLIAIAYDLELSAEQAEAFRPKLEALAELEIKRAKAAEAKALAEEQSAADFELASAGLTTLEYEKQAKLREVLNSFAEQGIELTREEVEAWREQVDRLAETEQKIERISALTDFIRDNGDAVSKLADLGVESIDKLTDAFVEFTQTGKFNFKELADFIVQELTRIAIKLLLVKALEAGLSLAGAGAGAGAGLGAGAGDIGAGGLISAPLAHTGGVVGALPSSRLASASAWSAAGSYAMGGIPGFKPGEVPAILHKKEAVVPLPSGKGIPVDLGDSEGGGTNITINFHGITDADSFRRNKNAIVGEIARAVASSKKRNGRRV